MRLIDIHGSFAASVVVSFLFVNGGFARPIIHIVFLITKVDVIKIRGNCLATFNAIIAAAVAMHDAEYSAVATDFNVVSGAEELFRDFCSKFGSDCSFANVFCFFIAATVNYLENPIRHMSDANLPYNRNKLL